MSSGRDERVTRERVPHPRRRDANRAKDVVAARALRARFETVFDQVLENADSGTIERAVAAPSNFGAVVRALNATAASIVSLTDLDPLAAAYARGTEQKAQLLKDTGALSVNEVAGLLGISRQAVDKRRREGKLIAVPKGSDFAYPAVQFEDGAVIPGLPELLHELGSSSWVALSFVFDPSDRLSGRSVLQVLKDGTPEQKQSALRMARIQAGDGFGD